MLSVLLPSNITVSIAPGYIKVQGPKGNFIKKTGSLIFNLLTTSQGTRLFVQGTSIKESAIVLSYLKQISIGLSRGFRQRLRLVGIGFRATIRNILPEGNKNTKAAAFKTFKRKNYRQKRRVSTPITQQTKALFLKIGFSHEAVYPLNSTTASSFLSKTVKETDVQVARLEGRSKGALICVAGADQSQVNQRAAEIRSFRFPDAYKGKGIHYDREVLSLKKGKRQG